jgi:hypothetical protein
MTFLPPHALEHSSSNVVLQLVAARMQRHVYEVPPAGPDSRVTTAQP